MLGDLAHEIGVGSPSSLSVFLNQVFVDQLLQSVPKLSIPSVSERGIGTGSLQATFIAQFGQGEGKGGGAGCLDLVEEVDIEFECCGAEVSKSVEGDLCHLGLQR